MKTKDIKSMLKKEATENSPEVLDNVKVSPINKLKKDEKSLVAFKKTMATLILVFLLVILIVLSVAIHGYMTQTTSAIENFTFMSVRIYNGTDSNGLESNGLKIYNLIIDDNGRIVLAYNETTGEKLASPTEFDDFVDLLDYDGEPTIYIVGASDGPAFARQYNRAIEDVLSADEKFEGANFVYHINDNTARNLITKSVTTLDGFDSSEHTEIDTIDSLCSIYLSILD